jgi:hypothetical protein
MSSGNVGRGGISLYKKWLIHPSHTNLKLFFLIDIIGMNSISKMEWNDKYFGPLQSWLNCEEV